MFISSVRICILVSCGVLTSDCLFAHKYSTLRVGVIATGSLDSQNVCIYLFSGALNQIISWSSFIYAILSLLFVVAWLWDLSVWHH